jgi:hypothetical protein
VGGKGGGRSVAGEEGESKRRARAVRKEISEGGEEMRMSCHSRAVGAFHSRAVWGRDIWILVDASGDGIS